MIKHIIGIVLRVLCLGIYDLIKHKREDNDNGKEA